MKRLTKRSRATTHKNGVCCTHFRSPECFAVDGNCASGCKWEEAARRSHAAYEDTGVSPVEIDCDHEAAGEHRRLCKNYDLGRLEAVIEADKGRRIAVLPCALGDTVWTNRVMSGTYLRLNDRPYPAKVVYIGLGICDDIGGGIFNVVFEKAKQLHMEQFDFSDIGRTVFLTHEEALNALEVKHGD